jgi:hypothetical protein
MPMMLALIMAGLCADLAAASQAAAPLIAPERVVIQIDQSGWGSQHRELTIARAATGFSDGTRRLDERLLLALVASVTAAPIPTIVPERLAIDAAELRRNAERTARAHFPPQTAAVAVGRLCDPKNLPKIVQTLNGSRQIWTDDHPSVAIEMTLSGGEKMTVRSTAQPPLMLPWRIERHGASTITFDPAISRAIAALLPSDFPNRHRVAGQYLEAYLADSLAVIGEGLATRASDEMFGAQLAGIRRRFHVERETVGYIMGFNTGGENVWEATLTAASLGAIGFELDLPVREKRAASADPFLRDADGLARRVGALSWVTRYLATHPKASASIQYYEDHSLGPHAREGVLRDLRHGGREALAGAIQPQLGDCVGFYLQSGENKFTIWILLPDGRSLLHYGDAMDGLPTARLGDLVTSAGAIEPPR